MGPKCFKRNGLNTTVSIIINWGFKVYACLRVLWWPIKAISALNCLNANRAMTLVMPWLRDIFHLKPKPIAISVLLCKLRSNFLFFFNNSTCVHLNACKLNKVWEAYVALSAMTIFMASLGSSLIVCWSTKYLILHVSLMMQSLSVISSKSNLKTRILCLSTSLVTPLLWTLDMK